MSGFFSLTIDKGVIAFVFGAIHQMMLLVPDLQMYTLACVELLWLLTRLSSLNNQVYRRKLAVVASLFSSSQICLSILMPSL